MGVAKKFIARILPIFATAAMLLLMLPAAVGLAGVPTVQSAEVTNANGAPANRVVLTFSEPIAGDESGFTIKVGGDIADIVDGLDSSNVLTLELGADVTEGQEVTIDYDATQGTVESQADDQPLGSFSGLAVTNKVDNTVPTATLTPADSALTNDNTPAVTAVFAEHVEWLNLAGVTFTSASGENDPVDVSATLGADDRTLTVTWTGELAEDDYRVQIPAGALADAAGNTNVSIEWGFSIDLTAPTATLAPEDGTMTTDPEVEVYAEFEDGTDIVEVDLTGVTMTAGNPENNPSELSAYMSQWDEGFLYVEWDGDLADDTYTVTIPAGAVADEAGNGNDEIIWSFTVDATAPAPDDVSNPNVTSVEISFDEALDGDVSGQQGAFTVTDTASTEYAVAATAAGSDATKLVLTVADFTGAIGDLTVDYDSGAGDLGDAAGNSVEDFSWAFTPQTDFVPPAVQSISNTSLTSIEISFDEALDGDVSGQQGAFRVTDAASTEYAVSATAAGSDATILVLTVPDVTGATGELTVEYNPFLGTLADAAGNRVEHFMTAFLPQTDFVAPTATLLTPGADALTNNRTPTVTALFSEPVGNANLGGVTMSAENGNDPTNVAAVLNDRTVTVTWDGELADDTYTVTIPANAVTDQAYNPNAQIQWSFTVDATAPTATLTPEDGEPTHEQRPVITVRFNETVIDQNLDATTITAGDPDNELDIMVQLSGDNQTVQVLLAPFEADLAEDTYTVTIPAGAVDDAAGNPNAQIQWSFTVDITRPTATLTPFEEVLNDATPAVTAVFNEDLLLLEGLGEVTLASATFSPPGLAATLGDDQRTVTVTWDGDLEDGDYTVTIPANAVEDAAYNPNAQIQWSFVVDATAPAVTALTPADGAFTFLDQPTVTAVFSEWTHVVDNLDGVTLTSASGDNNPTGVSATNDGETQTLTVTWTGALVDDTYTVTIPAGTLADEATNTNAEVQWSFTVDTTEPTFVSAAVSNLDGASANGVAVTFSEPVLIESALGFTINVDGNAATIDGVSGGGTDTLTLMLAAAVTEGQTVTIAYGLGSVGDLATNELWPFGPETVINSVDNTAPAATTAPADGALTLDNTPAVTAVFSEAVSVVADLTGVTLTSASGANDPVDVLATLDEDGNTKLTVAWTGDLADDTYTVTIPAGALQDRAANTNAEIQWSFTVDTTPPTATVAPVDDALTNDSTPAVTALFSEAVSVVDDLNGVTLTSASGANDPTGVSAALGGDGQTLTVTWNGDLADDTYTVTIPAGTLADEAANTNAEVQWSFTVDTTAPAYQGAALSNGDRRVTLAFAEPLVANTINLKAAITLAADGANFSALGANDTVTIEGATLVINFAHPLTGAANKIKVEAEALQDAAGNRQAGVTTDAISADKDFYLGLNPGWNLVSLPKWADVVSLVEEDIDAMLAYDGATGWVADASAVDQHLKNPASAVFIKANTATLIGFAWADAGPGATPASKSVSAGWNLIGTGVSDTANNILGPLRYESGKGMTTIHAPNAFNGNKQDGYSLAWATSPIDGTDWGAVSGQGLYRLDGYWIYLLDTTGNHSTAVEQDGAVGTAATELEEGE